MDLKRFIKSKFGKDIFSLDNDDLVKERIRIEKEIERVSDEIKNIEQNIQKLMLESKGQPTALKMLNVQKIKALRLEARTKQMEASHFLRELQFIMLLQAMKEREKSEKMSELTKEILESDVDELNKVLLDTDVQKALEEGKIEEVKEKLERVFGKEELMVDEESQELLNAINDLEKVDEETAIRIAAEKAKELSEEGAEKKKKELE
ncbi:MAG: hypothetical protein J7K72_03835 [Candidatus Aenigmarchaeota archaeon]|nr:hypothetical protein [Candidatus Aenigmarchaeota archaeon]